MAVAKDYEMPEASQGPDRSKALRLLCWALEPNPFRVLFSWAHSPRPPHLAELWDSAAYSRVALAVGVRQHARVPWARGYCTLFAQRPPVAKPYLSHRSLMSGVKGPGSEAL